MSTWSWPRPLHLLTGPPFGTVGRLRRSVLYPAAAVGLVGIGIPLIRAEQQMKATGGPGIVGLELAGPEKVDGVLEKWGTDGTEAARTSLTLDMLWLTTYVVLIAGVWTAVSERLHFRDRPWLSNLAGTAGWAAVAAGASDAVENTALLGVVTGRGPRQKLAGIAQRAAQIKFALLTVPVLGALGNLVARRIALRRA